MVTLFFGVCTVIILNELVKGLSTNGVPPVLQSFFWQIDLAYLMSSNIVKFRIILLILLGVVTGQIQIENASGFAVKLLVCASLWGGIYWLFNKFWGGKYRFLSITQKGFLSKEESKLDIDLPVTRC